MSRLIVPTLLLHLVFVAAPAAAQPPPEAQDATCDSLDSCVADLVAAAKRKSQVSEPIAERLASFGDKAVDALVPLLMDPDVQVRESAGLALTGFRRIDPRHLEALIEAWRHGDTINRQGRGNGWLPRPIAATGTEKALQLLWADFERDPETGSNAQTVFALAEFGEERIRPLVLKRFEECRRDASGGRCEGLDDLLREMKPRFPAWSVAEYVALASGAISDDVRQAAEAQLVNLRHQAGLPAFQRRLRDIPEDLDDDQSWYLRSLIAGISAYGPEARASGPLIVRFLDARYEEDLRAQAALALGAIGDSSATQALMALAPSFSDDWLLAYNAAESLGRLRAPGARRLLRRLARDHWHRGVRNNAARALAMIDGGAFARIGVPGDGRPYPSPEEDYLYMGDLRYAGDDLPRGCTPFDNDRTIALSQDPVGMVRWPRTGITALEVSDVAGSTRLEVRRRISARQVQGVTVAVLPTASGQLVAFNGGEFGGGLYHLPKNGPATALITEPVHSAWRMGGLLYVAAGLNHLVLDRGHLYVVDPGRLRVERTIRLPASPRRVSVSRRRVVILETGAGTVAIGEDGRLVAAEHVADCD